MIPHLLEPFRRAVATIRGDSSASATAPIAPPERPPAGPGDAEGGPALVPGTEPVAGYRLVALLGRGGFGEVWRAEGPGGFPLALKFVRLDHPVGEVEMRSLEVLKEVRHANLLSTFGSWQVGPRLVVAMELADRTLRDRLREANAAGHPGIPGPELLEYLREAAKGIDFLNEPRHSIGGKVGVRLQHRDIKPANILLVGNSVKVADFGLVRLLEDTHTTHTGSLTPAYAAPEFFAGKTTPTSDQYCLAVTYCQLRGGRLPFEGNLAQLLKGHLEEPPDLTMLPDAERPVVARALAKDPKQRWPTCAAFENALKDAATNRTTGGRCAEEFHPNATLPATPGPPPPERPPDPTRRGEPSRVPPPRDISPGVEGGGRAKKKAGAPRRVVPPRPRPPRKAHVPSRAGRSWRSDAKVASTILVLTVAGFAIWSRSPTRHPRPPVSTEPGPPARPPGIPGGEAVAAASSDAKGVAPGPSRPAATGPPVADAVKERLERADALRKRGDNAGAIPLYDEVIALDPRNAVAHNNRGIAYIAGRNLPRALADFSEAIRLGLADAPTYSNRARVYAELGDHERAVDDYSRVLDLWPDSAEARFGRGTERILLSRHEEAERDLTEALRLDPGNVESHFNRGLAYEALGNSGGALADYNEVIRLDRDYLPAYRRRAELHARQGHAAGAEADRAEIRRLEAIAPR